MKSVARYHSAKLCNYKYEGETRSFYIATVEDEDGILEVGINNEDVDYYVKGKAYTLYLTKDYKGKLKLVLGLEISA
jgi:hypothetical protein